MDRAVIIGSSPAALRAAAVLASRGLETRYIGTAAEAAGVPAEPPFGLGAVGLRGDLASLGLERIWGSVSLLEGGNPRRAVFVDGRTFDLPLSRAVLARMLGVRAATVAAGVARARLRTRLGNVFDLGNEDRSYRDWIVRRLGPSLYERLFESYAVKRFAADPAEIVPFAAWRTHFAPLPERWVAPGAGAAAARVHQREAVLAAGGEVLDDVGVERLEVEDGRIVAVDTANGREHVGRWLLTDTAPRDLARLLPDTVVDQPWRFDVSRLETAHAVQVTVPARVEDLPWELHVVDADRPFWRLTRPGLLPGEDRWRGFVTAHLTLRDDDPLWRGSDKALVQAVRGALGGIAEPEAGDGVVQRLPHAIPVHRLVAGPCLGRRLDAMDLLGVVGIGRGAYRESEPADDLRFVDGLLARDEATRAAARRPGDKRVVDQHEVHRMVFERPVRLPDRVSPWSWASD